MFSSVNTTLLAHNGYVKVDSLDAITQALLITTTMATPTIIETKNYNQLFNELLTTDHLIIPDFAGSKLFLPEFKKFLTKLALPTAYKEKLEMLEQTRQIFTFYDHAHKDHQEQITALRDWYEQARKSVYRLN